MVGAVAEHKMPALVNKPSTLHIVQSPRNVQDRSLCPTCSLRNTPICRLKVRGNVKAEPHRYSGRVWTCYRSSECRGTEARAGSRRRLCAVPRSPASAAPAASVCEAPPATAAAAPSGSRLPPLLRHCARNDAGLPAGG